MTQIFVNAAIDVFKGVEEFSCNAIYQRVGHGFSRALERYRLMFEPQREWYAPGYTFDCHFWWNCVDVTTEHETREARIYALLLVHEIYSTGDL